MAVDPICGMQVKESSSLRVTFEGEEQLFCSTRCLERFCQEHSLSLNAVSRQEKNLPNCCRTVARPWYQNKSFIVAAILVGACGLSYVVPGLVPFRQTLTMYFQMIWLAVALGLVLGGLIDHFVPRELVSNVLARHRKRTVFYSVGLGFLMSACSHGILALAIQLHKKGASTPAVISFLLASPWANLPLTLIMVSFFGLVKGAYIILVAVIVAINSGLIFQVLEEKGWVERNANAVLLSENYSAVADIRQRMRQYHFSRHQLRADAGGVWRGTVALGDMVLWWILIGIGLASVSGAYIPSHFFHSFMGPNLKGMLVTLLGATVLEVCSEGTAPLAFEIYRQTGALGNSFVFLMAGVATDYTEIGLLWHNVGRKTALWLPIVTVPQILIFGILANILFH